MTKKRDFSRLVVLTMKPNEAVYVAAVLDVVVRGHVLPEGGEETVKNIRDHITLQLRNLHYPINPFKTAPYPV